MALGGSGRTEGGSSPRPFCLSVEKSETFSYASGFSLKAEAQVFAVAEKPLLDP